MPCSCLRPRPVGVGGWLCAACGKPTVMVIRNDPPSDEQMESSDDFEEE